MIEWKAVVGFEDLYEVSNEGSVRSLSRVVACRPKGLEGHTRLSPGKSLQPDEVQGYCRVTLCKDGQHTRKMIHVLVLEAFIGPCPEGMECCHRDGSRSNNRVDNLRWGTKKENASDRDGHGRTFRGESQWNAKMTEEKVREVRLLYATGKYLLRELGERFDVHLNVIHSIIHERTWKHVE